MAKKNNTPAKPKLPPEEALYQALSLCRKAGALTMGFDAVEDACVKSKAWLVMVASDASAKTVQRLDYSVGIDTNVGLHAKVPLIAFLGLLKAYEKIAVCRGAHRW